MRSPNINTDEDSVATVAVNNSGWSSSQAITVEITPNYSNLLEQERRGQYDVEFCRFEAIKPT